ncbi:MAG: hypothetical protein K2Y22_16490 [Candidatus Obscuribacterales bacterium]|nr:hypothetical protein [Candidatus Obscuribacterales bacterium]
MRKFAVLLLAVSTLLTAPAWAADADDDGEEKEKKPSYIRDTSSIGQSRNGVVAADQILELGVLTPNSLQLQAEQSLRMGNLDRALMVLQRCVEMAPLDVEARMTYSQALEQVLTKQKKRDPKLFNFLVKQWLFVAKKAEFPDQKMQAYSKLYDLTGAAPGRFERADKYLARVLLPEDGSIPVALNASHHKKKEKKDEI